MTGLAFLLLFGVVHGKVTDGFTGQAVKGGKVLLVAADRTMSRAPFQGLTGGEGEYRIANVPPGEYQVFIGADGYSETPKGYGEGRVVAVGSELRLTLELVRKAKLLGRVFGTDGQPLAGVEVRAERQPPGMVVMVDTNAKGEYTISQLDPGRYRVVAQAGAPRSAGRKRRSGEGPAAPKDEEGQRQDWAPTWYPSGLDAASAALIDVMEGVEIGGIDVRLRVTPVFEIRGQVIGPDGQAATNTEIMLHPWPGSPFVEKTVVTGEQGTFRLERVRRGEWLLEATSRLDRQTVFGSAVVSMDGRDVDNVRIRLVRPVLVTGRLEGLEGAAAAQVPVRLKPSDLAPAFRARATSDAAGGLRFRAVRPGRYRVRPAEPPGYYVAAIQFGGQDVQREEVTIDEGAPEIRVVYRKGGATLRGVVEEAGEVRVVLLPAEEPLRDLEYFRAVTSGKNGEFEFRSVRPGEYIVYALPSARLSDFNDAGYRQLLPPGARVRLKDSETASIEIRMTPRPAW